MSKRIEREELIRRVAQRTGQDEKLVQEIVNGMLEEIYQSMKQFERVSLRNFGTFYIDQKYSRMEREETTVFKFNPSQKWRALFGWSSSYEGEL